MNLVVVVWFIATIISKCKLIVYWIDEWLRVDNEK